MTDPHLSIIYGSRACQTRGMTPKERARIAAAYGVNCDTIPPVTVCPPATYSEGAFNPVPWKEQVRQAQRVGMAQRRIIAARDDDQIAEMRGRGMSLRQIASVLGRSNPAILARVRVIEAKRLAHREAAE